MDMRNKVVAHSEREYRDVVVLPAGYTTPAGPTLTKATTAVATHQFTLKGPKTIRSHIQRLKAEVQADLDVQIERLFRALKGEPSHPVNALGEEQQWTPNQPPTPFPLPGDPTT
jgi:hypothetical protein